MRLAEYLLDARAGGAPDGPDAGEAWQVALARLALDGVDTAQLGAGSTALRLRGGGLSR